MHREHLSLVPAAEELLSAGAFVISNGKVHGLIYAPFVRYLKQRWGIQASVKSNLPVGELAERVTAGQLAIASVHPSIRDAPGHPPGRGGHLVTVWSKRASDLRFVNPSGVPGISQHAQLSIPTFDGFYARRAVLIEPR